MKRTRNAVSHRLKARWLLAFIFSLAIFVFMFIPQTGYARPLATAEPVLLLLPPYATVEVAIGGFCQNRGLPFPGPQLALAGMTPPEVQVAIHYGVEQGLLADNVYQVQLAVWGLLGTAKDTDSRFALVGEIMEYAQSSDASMVAASAPSLVDAVEAGAVALELTNFQSASTPDYYGVGTLRLTNLSAEPQEIAMPYGALFQDTQQADVQNIGVFPLAGAVVVTQAGPVGPQGEVGPQGPAGPEGPQGEKGDTGPQGPQGEAGPQGAAGLACWDSNGNGKPDPAEDTNGDGKYDALDCIGAMGPQGAQGDTGPQGVAGPVGPAGPEGEKGDTGPQGEKGDSGPQGDKGDVGAMGPQGVAGPIGPQGEKGDSGPQGPQGDKGDVGAIGPQGEKGDAGPMGPAGPEGPKGDAGPQGPQGEKGDAGPMGPAGPEGPKGDAGPQGPQGEKGDAGPMGPQGIAGVACWDLNGNGAMEQAEDVNSDGKYDALDCLGAVGPQGDKGDTGPQGPQGEKGDTGPQGVVGAVGPTGPQGPQGPAGPVGPTGAKGDAGPMGPQGEKGDTGPQGPLGLAGYSCWDTNGNGLTDKTEDVNADGNYDALDCVGPMGPAGPMGLTGPMGATGPVGPAGPPGLLDVITVMDMTPLDTEPSKEITVMCEDGLQVLSGGFDVDGPDSADWIIAVQESYPVDNQGWHVRAEAWNARVSRTVDCGCADDGWKITVWAICGEKFPRGKG